MKKKITDVISGIVTAFYGLQNKTVDSIKSLLTHTKHANKEIMDLQNQNPNPKISVIMTNELIK